MPACIRLPTFLAAVLSLCLLASSIAHAICTPDVIYKRYVGSTTTDNLCTDNDIQSAINNAVCPSIIYITDEHTYTAQHLDINNKNLTLVGTTNSCGPQACDIGCVPPTTPQVVIDGAGHSGDSVVYIHGTSNVTLKYLQIRNGNNINGAANTYGGGIHFDGRGSLVLDTDWVDFNTARFGGGINFNGNGGFAGLTVLANTRIANNTAANSGGGIRVTGSAYATLLNANTAVWLNHAPNGYGGGINVVGPASVDIGSSGLAGLGILYSNDANYGGAVAITAGSGGDARVNLFTTDPLQPVRVLGNFATSRGGAFYLKPYVGVPGNGFATLCTLDYRIEGNAAPEGSAIYADNDSTVLDPVTGSDFYLGGGCGNLSDYSQPCANGVTCNTVSDNDAVDAANIPTLGSTLYLTEKSSFFAARLDMRGNRGGYAIRLIADPFGNTAMYNCLLVENQLSRNLISIESGGLSINNCTIANNAILSTDTIHAEGPFALANSIIDQPGNLALAYSGNLSDLQVNYVLSSDVSTLAGVGVSPGRPIYVNAAAGNYRLAINSRGVDYAPAIAGDDIDIDKQPYDQDLPEVTDLYGVRDLGAYERQRSCGANDSIFCNGFESP